ncbi:hypothetical protein GCM10028784_37850 [Myceligenerans cantabricum]
MSPPPEGSALLGPSAPAGRSVRVREPGPGLRDPADTIVVIGGTGTAAVDAAEVRLAAARIAGAADGLRRAAALSGAAWADVATGPAVLRGVDIGSGAVGPPAPGTLGPATAPAVLGAEGPAALGVRTGPEAAARRSASGAVEGVTAGLRASAEVADLLGWRLLRAAGLYDEAEGLTERLIGALLTAEGFAVGAALGMPPVLQLLGGAYRAGGGTGAGRRLAEVVGLAEPRGPGAARGGAGEPAGDLRRPPGDGDGRTAGGSGGVVRGIAPWTDELAYGFGHGIAWSTGSGRGVPGAAGELVDAVRAAPVGALGERAELERLGPGDFSGGPPAWRGSGARTLDEALLRVDDLYPRNGAPEATVAVQRLSGPGDVTSWVVLVPGTQAALPAGHPWDGLTDLELVAEHPDQATEAVEEAMSDAGIGPGEPVVLVGHSLGGIAVTALASRPAFAERYRVGGVVTAGAPVATFRTPPGVPALHLETAEEVVSAMDGRSSAENPRSADRVTAGRTLGASSAAADRAASGEVSGAHSIGTHARTLTLAREAGDVRVAAVVDRIEPYLRGDRADTTFYRAARAPRADPAPSPGPSP